MFCLSVERQSDSPAVHYFRDSLPFSFPRHRVTVFQFSLHKNLQARNLHSENEE